MLIFANDFNSKRKFKIKANKMFVLKKGLFYRVTLIKAVEAKTLGHFYKISIVLKNMKKYLDPAKISLFTLQRAEINGGGGGGG